MHARFGNSARVIALAAIAAGMVWLVWAVAVQPLPGSVIGPGAGHANPANVTAPIRQYLPQLDWKMDRSMVERPIFEKTRRPQFNTPAPDVRAQVARAEELPPPTGLKLLGVMRDQSGNASALVASRKRPQGEWYRRGASIDGWRVNGIETGTITLEAGSKVYPLQLYSQPALDQ